MSIEAISWALKRRGLRSSEKFVLVCLANFANEALECYPSIAALVAATSLDQKTVRASLQRLIVAGFIQDTGSRKGATGQIPIYRLVDPAVVEGLETERLPKTEPSRISRERLPDLDRKTPKNGTRNHQEPSGNQNQGDLLPENTNARTSKGKEQGTNTTPPIALPTCVPAELWAGFIADRVERKKPMTARAQSLALARLERMHAEGHDVRTVIEQSIEKGWSGFFSVKDDAPATQGQSFFAKAVA